MEQPRQNRWILLAAAALVGGLALLTAWLTEFSSDPLSVLPDDVPEIEARRVYQTFFLPENDLVIVVKARPPADATLVSGDLAEFLRENLPHLDPGRIRDRHPWEDPGSVAELGSLAAFAWANAPPDALDALAKRLNDPARVQQLLDGALDTLGNSVILDSSAAWLSIDPLKLAEVPGLPKLNRSVSAEQLGHGQDAVRAILIDLPGNRNSAREMAPWFHEIEALVARWRSESPESAGADVLVSGFVPFIVELTSSMKLEMLMSAVLTLTIVLILFIAVYRTAYPLAVLAVTLGFVALTTVLIGGFIFGQLNPISIGFAAILIALVVDYAVIVYQERIEPSDPGDTFAGAVVKPVLWAAGTTALVFAALNLSALPGIAQLGSLVAIGLGIGAVASLTFFRILISRKTIRESRNLGLHALQPRRAVVVAVALVVVAGCWLGFRGLPGLNTGPDTLLPKQSESMLEFEAVLEELEDGSAPAFAVLFRAGTNSQVREAMIEWDRTIRELEGLEPLTPIALWPRGGPGDISDAVRQILGARDAVITAIEADFEAEAVGFAKSAFVHFDFMATTGEIKPTGLAKELWDQVASFDALGRPAAKGLVFTDEAEWSEERRQQLLALADEREHVILLGQENLDPVMRRLFEHDGRWVVLPSILVLLVVLFVVFRSFRGVGLAVLTLALSTALLLSLMRILGIEWNQINLMAVPLLIGAGLDYNIHIQLGLRRTGGNLEAVSRTLGKALLVCGCSTAVGFGSLVFSRHAGLASLGQTCALGIVSTMLVAVFLLPGWWVAARKLRTSFPDGWRV